MSLDLKDLHKLNSDFERLSGFATALAQRQAFALENFQSVLFFAISLMDEKMRIASTKPKHAIADNYPAGYQEPCCDNCELTQQLAEKDKVIEQLVDACQGAVVAINETMDAIAPIFTLAGLPPFPPPPIQGIKDAIIAAGGVVYENAADAMAALAAAKGK